MGVVLRRELLDPQRHGFYAVQLFTHKLLRRTMVFPLGALAVTSPLLRRRGRLYRAATLAQVVLYGLGGAGILLADKPLGRRKAFTLPAFFCFVNAPRCGPRGTSFAAARSTAGSRSATRPDTLIGKSIVPRGRAPGASGLMLTNEKTSLDQLGVELKRLRDDPATAPDASVVIPVNAQEDLENVLAVLGDLARYEGSRTRDRARGQQLPRGKATARNCRLRASRIARRSCSERMASR